MKKVVFLCCFFLLTINCISQEFPAAYLGIWKGELLWYKTGVTKPQKVNMQLVIQPSDTINQYKWHLSYGEKNQDNRPYVLKRTDTSASHWIIDEQNGIILDQYLVNNKLIGAFTVQQNTIMNSYSIEKNRLIVEFFTINAGPINTSGGKEGIPTIMSYQVKGYQKAVLKKVHK
jgi:hypothetical protein